MPIRMQEPGRGFLRLLTRPTAYPVTQALFLRLLGFIYLFAFGSLIPQITGLLGSHGIVPAVLALKSLRGQLGAMHGFLLTPSVFWLACSDSVLLFSCVLGCLFSVVLIFSTPMARLAATLC